MEPSSLLFVLSEVFPYSLNMTKGSSSQVRTSSSLYLAIVVLEQLTDPGRDLSYKISDPQCQQCKLP